MAESERVKTPPGELQATARPRTLSRLAHLAMLWFAISACSDERDDEASSESGDRDEPSPDDGTAFLPADSESETDGTRPQCDFWGQDCPEDEKCVPSFSPTSDGVWDTHYCVPITGSGSPGDSCTFDGPIVHGKDDCDATSVCVTFTELGSCMEMCHGTEDQPSCPITDGNCIMGPNNILNLCVDRCNPIADDCGNSSHACLPNFDGNGFSDFICFWPSDHIPYGEPCEYVNACESGTVCIGDDAFSEAGCGSPNGCCTRYCDTSQPADDVCTFPGQECVSWWEVGETPLPGLEDLGTSGAPL